MDTVGIVIVFSVLMGNVDVCFSADDWRFAGKIAIFYYLH